MAHIEEQQERHRETHAVVRPKISEDARPVVHDGDARPVVHHGRPGSHEDGHGAVSAEGEVTVATLLGEPMLRGRLLGGASGLHHPVSWCLPLSEVASAAGARRSPPPYSDPADRHDLEGMAVHVPAAELAGHVPARALVEDLARRGAAAVLARQAPGGVVDLGAAARAADDVGLPLVGLSPEADYRSVGRLVAVKAIAGTAHVLEYGVRVHRTLGEVFASGSGLPALAGSMSTLARATVLIIDEYGEVLAGAGGGRAIPSEGMRELAADLYRRLTDAAPRHEGSGHGRHVAARDMLVDSGHTGRAHAVVAPVSVAGQAYGAVAVVEPVLPPDAHDLAQHRVIVEQGAPLVASEMLRLRSVAEAEERARDDFLDSLVHGRFTDVHALEARSRHYRFDVAGRHAVFVVAAPPLDAVRAQHLLRSVTASRGGAPDGFTMAGYIGHLLVVVRELAPSGVGARFDAQAESGAIQRFGKQVRRAVSERVDGPVQLTHGRGALGAAGVAASYREARIALELSQRVDVPEVCGYERLRVFAAIEEAAASAQGRAFAREVLEPLRRVDGQTGDLEQVVLAYIAESGNLNAAARRLQLHRNTMLYKLERASRALQMDIRAAETQFTVWLAHRIHTLNDSLRALEAELSPPA